MALLFALHAPGLCLAQVQPDGAFGAPAEPRERQRGGLEPQGEGGAASTSGAAPTAAGGGARPAWQGFNHEKSAFPPAPRGFVRFEGRYVNMLLLVPTIAVFLIWTASSHWVSSDASNLKLRPAFWNSVMLVAGVAAFVTAFTLPHPAAAFLAMNVLWGLPLGLYVKERNGRVPESGKVLTPDHIYTVLVRTLAKVGIHIGSREVREAAVGPPIRFIGKSTTGREEDDVRSRQVENSRGILAAKELIYDAILRRATDVHLEPKEQELSVRLRIDGVMYPTEPFERTMGDAIVNIFKVLGAMDITERRRPQDGSFRARLEDRDIDFRVATQGTRHGQKMSLRILDQANSVGKMAQLGFRKQMLEQMQEIIHQPHGMLVVCGPTGAGKSTTLYAAINEIDAYQRNVITVEDPIEYKMENVNQIEVNTRSGQTFASSLRSILRQDPDVVMIGEIRDAETAEIACQAANTGHMVFSTVHANDTLTALYRIQELGVEPFMVANSISAIIGQRLARRLCTDCKEAYKPKPEFLRKAGLPTEKVERFYRPPKNREEPCAKCGGLGFFGRVGVFEFLVINERMRDMIRDKAPMQAIRAEARKNGMLQMKEEGLRLVVRGVTSIDELLRVVK
ncbi:MAG: GspE/PulE family protein [Planctomycetes bacterium]|nr:GspE/PulE family protein [Planctomycetota bacterium]